MSQQEIKYYHSPTQFKFDSWHQLEGLASRLVTKNSRGDSITSLVSEVGKTLNTLRTIEEYTAFPSPQQFNLVEETFEAGDYEKLSAYVSCIVRSLSNDAYRKRRIDLEKEIDLEVSGDDELVDIPGTVRKPYFEVLFVDKNGSKEMSNIKRGLNVVKRHEDKFDYDVIAVPSFEDALIAILFNYNIQACVIQYSFPLHSKNTLPIIKTYLNKLSELDYENTPENEQGLLLGAAISELRPELDLFLVTDESVEFVAGRATKYFQRIFYQQEDYLELHLNILRGIQERYETPFFTALRNYSSQPTGVFHAMPISRGKSVTKSNWIRDMVDFYGINIFLAETSATSGGLDSLLMPHGPIKRALLLASRAFHSKKTYFVTNGTSTANKIVVQALIQPDDIVLIDRDCHKSHHYGLVQSGALLCYLDSYPLHKYSMYGGVPLRDIKQVLLQYKATGKLDQVKMLSLTNCTFDGVVYNVERVMEECLAIKPDLIFLWDEAWFAFASLTPTYRQRTGMATAGRLVEKFKTDEYRKTYEAQQSELEGCDHETLLNTRLLPNPDLVKLRVYTTHSTHKSLTALRQGSMIHIYDQEFHNKVGESFDDAFMMHTSTSPNYQILASLDLGRRQVELEGFEMVQKQIELAMVIREQVATSPFLSKYFSILDAEDLIPAEYRQSNVNTYFDEETIWSNDRMEVSWGQDDFVVDLTRITLDVGKTGIDGETFKNTYLMEKHGIQINKTSRNTVLLMTNIGTTRSSVAFFN